MDISTPIAHQLREARLAANMTQAEAADLCGCAHRTWRRWESLEWTPKTTRNEALHILLRYVREQENKSAY